MEKKYDVVIIGSGISGMTCAIFLKRAGINPLIIEGKVIGGLLNKITSIENYPGYVSVDGPTLSTNIYNQITNLNIDYLYEEVISIDNNLITTKNHNIKTKYIVIASGRSERLLGLSNEQDLIGRGISYCALCDGMLYKDKQVIVVGGGSSALEEAIYLSKICKSVIIIHRNNSFRGEIKLINDVKNIKNIKVIFNRNIIKINEKNGIINEIVLDNNKKIKTNGLFICIGYNPNSNFINVEKDNGYIIVNNNYETSINNIYAIGDVIKKDYYQLVSATFDGMTVAGNITKKMSNNNEH